MSGACPLPPLRVKLQGQGQASEPIRQPRPEGLVPHSPSGTLGENGLPETPCQHGEASVEHSLQWARQAGLTWPLPQLSSRLGKTFVKFPGALWRNAEGSGDLKSA